MNVGGLGLASSVAASLPQMRAAEAVREQQSANEQTRQSANDRHAESAAGIGEMAEDAEAGDRDADGRRLWERPPASAAATDDPDAQAPPLSLDPSGTRGGNLDVRG